MAEIDRMGYRAGAAEALGIRDGFEDILNWVRKAIADDVWRWYAENEDMRIVTLKKWFLSFTVRVKHVRPLLVLLFGEPGFGL